MAAATMSVTQFGYINNGRKRKEEEEETEQREKKEGEETDETATWREGDEDESEDDELTPLNPDVRRGFSDRAGRVDWCHCRNCVPMATDEESRCCHEDPQVWEKMLEDGLGQGGGGGGGGEGTFRCVVDHPFFVSVCLNPYTIQALYDRDKLLFADMLEHQPPHEKYRLTSHRAFVDYFYGRLEGFVTSLLPSCAASTIRGIFPDHAFLIHVPGYCPM